MALRQKLTKPMVIEPSGTHSHTVVFLHRFPADISEQDLQAKLLSAKLTSNRKSLRDQFPTVRWIFPHAKLHDASDKHSHHWAGLSLEDLDELGLDHGPTPYITQIILNENRLLGDLERVIVGGQGETAVAVHDAITKFPEIPTDIQEQPELIEDFLHQNFPGSSNDVSKIRLGGFIGMHAPSDETTRDQRAVYLMSKFANHSKINDNMIINTPHRFIHGGFKKADCPGDGSRIDDFAAFLSSIGVAQTSGLVLASRKVERRDGPIQAPPDTSRHSAQNKLKRELAEKEKYQQLLKKQKVADKQARDRVLLQIEDDRQARREREERKRQAREAASAKSELRDGIKDEQD